MLIPISTLRSSILEFHREIALYPLWICPMRLLSPAPSTGKMSELMPANVDRPSVRKLPPGEKNAEVQYPLACPIAGGMVSPTHSEQLYVDIGAYGVPQAKQWSEIVLNIYGRVKGIIETDGSGGEVEDASDEDANEEFHVRVMRRVSVHCRLYRYRHHYRRRHHHHHHHHHQHRRRQLEGFVRANHGYQALYADCFQTKEEFREMFDHELYDRLRVRYGCIGRLPDIYDKVSRHARK